MLATLYGGLGPAPEVAYYSEGLRLRPNYLIYTRAGELSASQKEFLVRLQIPWAEYLNASALAALVAYLKRVQGGIYLPAVRESLGQKHLRLALFLLDPHLIDDFEATLSPDRQGVLIRRPLLASQDFKDTIKLD